MVQTDMQGKVCLVTGSNSGIGKATALGLAKLGATVVLVCRDQHKGEAAQHEIKTQSGNAQVDLLLADLSSQVSIRKLAQEFTTTYPRLDVLINNAGTSPSKRNLTVDGLETTFAVNHLSYFLLTHLLLDTLKYSVPARIINVASSAYSPLNFEDLQREKSYRAMQVYSQSKFATILFTYELARRLTGTGVTVNCVHPGVISTNLARDYNLAFRLLARFLFSSPEKGALTSLYVASSPELEGVTGKYFAKSKEERTSSQTYDEAIAQRLWQASERLTKVGQVSV